MVKISPTAGGATALAATADDIHYSTGDQIEAAVNPSLNWRYVKPWAVGAFPERIPATALAPIPPNILHYPPFYGLGQAVYHGGPLCGCDGDAKGRATHDRHPGRSGWSRQPLD